MSYLNSLFTDLYSNKESKEIGINAVASFLIGNFLLIKILDKKREIIIKTNNYKYLFFKNILYSVVTISSLHFMNLDNIDFHNILFLLCTIGHVGYIWLDRFYIRIHEFLKILLKKLNYSDEYFNKIILYFNRLIEFFRFVLISVRLISIHLIVKGLFDIKKN